MVTTKEKLDIAVLQSKLEGTEFELLDKARELETLRRRAAKLEADSVVGKLQAEQDELRLKLSDAQDLLALKRREVAESERVLASAGPALALAKAIGNLGK